MEPSSPRDDHIGERAADAELALMRALKATLDPAGILNPGKVFPVLDQPGM